MPPPVHRYSLLLGVAAALALAQAGHAAPSPGGDTKAAVAKDAEASRPRKAEKATSIPEPGSPTVLFLLAAGGLALGRRLSRSPRRRPRDG